MTRRRLLEIGAMAALGVIYAAAWITAFIWNWPTADSELTVHIVVMLVTSLMFGALIVDMKKTLMYSVGSMVIGIMLASVVIAMPALIAEGPKEIEASFTVALSTISKLFIVSISFLIIGLFIGCFVGDAITGIEQDQEQPSN